MKTLLELKTVKLEQLNNDEYANFIRSLLSIMQNTTLEQINVEQEVFDELSKHQNDLTIASRQNRFSEESQQINTYDRQRCDYAVFLLSSFRFEQKNSLSNRKEAASTLYKYTKIYSGIQTLPTRQRTQAIESLLKELAKPELEKHIRTLGVAQTIASLSESNKEYHKLIEGRAENQANNILINSKNIRKRATNLFRYISRCALSTHTITQSAESAAFITLLNKLIADTTHLNKQRLSSNIVKPTLLEDKTEETDKQ